MPKISCILAAYNAQRYLRPAIESVLAQTFRDFELVIVDDGSTDTTPAIADEYARLDPRVRVIHQKNAKQVIAARNGIDSGDSPLIARLDADDIAKPDRFAKQVAYFDAHPDVVLLGGAYEMIDDAGRLLTTIRQPEDDATLQEICLTGRCPICQPLAMFRRDAYEKVGGYRPAFVTAEDLDLWLLLGEVGKMACLPDVLIQYRQHQNSISEVNQKMMIGHQRESCAQAWERRGVVGKYQFMGETPWRATGDRNSRHAQVLKYGWWAWKSGVPSTARHYAWQAIRSRPLHPGGWKLLLAGLKQGRDPS